MGDSRCSRRLIDARSAVAELDAEIRAVRELGIETLAAKLLVAGTLDVERMLAVEQMLADIEHS